MAKPRRGNGKTRRTPKAEFPTSAIILAAGLGLRMRPLTDTMPKPLVQVAGRCLIDYSLDFVESAGITDVVVNASYKAEMLQDYLAQRRHPQIRVSREESPLETGGGIREALPYLGDAPFISINSDVVCINGRTHALHRLREAWDDERMDALLLVVPVERAVGYEGPGDFFVAPDGTITRREERVAAPYIFTGIQLLHPRFFRGCPLDGAFSLNVLYNRDKGETGVLSRVFALSHDGDWLHIGDMPGLKAAEAYFAASSREAIRPSA